MARDSSFCFVVSFFFVVLLCNGPSIVDATRVMVNSTKAYTYWCIAKKGLSDDLLQKVIDVYCGKPGVDCSVISPGGTCFEPDTKYSHASYVLDAFLVTPTGGCPQEGEVVYEDPSYGTCIYPSWTD